jgi:hypothetical protein
VLRELLLLCRSVSEYLQSADMDMLASITAISDLTNKLQAMRKDSQTAFHKMYEAACTTCCKPTIRIATPTADEPQLKRKRQAPRHLQGQFVMDRFLSGAGDTVVSSGTLDSKETTLRIDLFIPILEAVLSSITDRFSKQATEFMTHIMAFSPEHWASERSKEAVSCLAAAYSLDAALALAQYDLLVSPKDADGNDDVHERTERAKCKSLASLLAYMHQKKLSAVYREIYKLLEICATIPVTSACNERSHSKLKLIKTETRSTSGDERTEALLAIAVEKQICNAMSLSSLVDTFALKPRKIKL